MAGLLIACSSGTPPEAVDGSVGAPERCASDARCAVEGAACSGDTLVECRADGDGCLYETRSDCRVDGWVCDAHAAPPRCVAPDPTAADGGPRAPDGGEADDGGASPDPEPEPPPDAGGGPADLGPPADGGVPRDLGPPDEPDACGDGRLQCDGRCVPCPSPETTARHACVDGACVSDVCDPGLAPCAAGCCEWVRETLAHQPGAPSIAIDGDGVAHVAWTAAGGVVLMRPGIDVGPRQIGVEPTSAVSLEAAETGVHAFYFSNGAERGLRHLRWQEAESELAWITRGNLEGRNVATAVDADGNIHLAYRSEVPEGIAYRMLNDAGPRHEIVLEESLRTVRWDIGVGPQGPVVSYGLEDGVSVARRQPDGMWAAEAVDGRAGPARTALAIDGAAAIHLGYTPLTGRSLPTWYARRAGDGPWQTREIAGPDYSGMIDVRVDEGDRPHLLYCVRCDLHNDFGDSITMITHAWYSGRRWVRSTLAGQHGVLSAAMAVDLEGLAHVVLGVDVFGDGQGRVDYAVQIPTP